MTAISIPQSVSVYGTEAFYGCRSLGKVTFSQSVTYLPKDVFPQTIELVYE
ncbi:MAG: leucine-rich repeat protein [Paludibacteraceae bacterium]|nr:leucine-rich repeat protein [Paludibacteraceae bacterium]